MSRKIISLMIVLCMLFSMGTVTFGAQDKFIPAAEKYRKGNEYLVFNEGVTWEEAQEYCEKIGGHLVTITSQEEQDFVSEMLEGSDCTKSLYWIGAKEEGQWKWTTGEEFDYTNWHEGEPTSGQYYLSMYTALAPENIAELSAKNITDKSIHGKWLDNPNSGIDGWSVENSGFICEIESVKAGSAHSFEGHTYCVFDKSLSWEAAKDYCSELGGHLATITTEEEQQFIETLLEEGQKKQYWIGMRTAGGPNWITGETYEYSNWDKGEPNNQHKASSDEDYVHIYNVANPAVWGSERFKWNDMFGDNTFPGEEDNFALKYVGFICEWDYVSSSFGSEISEWASEEVEVAYDKELIPEILVGKDLTQPITRAEFAAVSVKTYELMANTKALPAVNNPFTDTKDVEVLKAYNTGITTGVSATEFAPNALLNREQAATMLTRVFKRSTMKGWTVETDAQFELDYKKPAVFADDSRISEWAKDSVYFMAANEIINGVGGNKFAPQNTTSEEEATGYANATREQALIIATRMVENLK